MASWTCNALSTICSLFDGLQAIQCNARALDRHPSKLAASECLVCLSFFEARIDSVTSSLWVTPWCRKEQGSQSLVSRKMRACGAQLSKLVGSTTMDGFIPSRSAWTRHLSLPLSGSNAQVHASEAGALQLRVFLILGRCAPDYRAAS